MAIRRSLRLGPKRTTTAAGGEEVVMKKQFSYPEGDSKADPFSEFTQLRRQPCEQQFGTIADLRHLLQMNRPNQFEVNSANPVTNALPTPLLLCKTRTPTLSSKDTNDQTNSHINKRVLKAHLVGHLNNVV
uniref:Uncharacterized protein n=1 Tax=Ditylenchus dipsaci TaxID=166011 RepID=A0A915E2Q5_9BILA